VVDDVAETVRSVRTRHWGGTALVVGHSNTIPDLIAGLTGRPPEFFRAPAGFRSPLLDPVLAQCGLRYVSWTRRGFDAVDGDVQRVAARLDGLAAAGLLTLADREPRVLFAIVMLFSCFEVFFAAMVVTLAEWLLEGIPWWTILGGNLVAALVMLGFFLRGHRVTWHEFLHARR